jgi:hypothetical protein
MMIFLFCCLGIGSAAKEDVTANTALLWQGFEHNWQLPAHVGLACYPLLR